MAAVHDWIEIPESERYRALQTGVGDMTAYFALLSYL
jgi:hypothetical protein